MNKKKEEEEEEEEVSGWESVSDMGGFRRRRKPPFWAFRAGLFEFLSREAGLFFEFTFRKICVFFFASAPRPEIGQRGGRNTPLVTSGQRRKFRPEISGKSSPRPEIGQWVWEKLLAHPRPDACRSLCLLAQTRCMQISLPVGGLRV